MSNTDQGADMNNDPRKLGYEVIGRIAGPLGYWMLQAPDGSMHRKNTVQLDGRGPIIPEPCRDHKFMALGADNDDEAGLA